MKETKSQRDLRLITHQIVRLEAMREGAIKTLVKVETTLPILRHKRKKLADRQLSKLNRHPVSGPGVAQDPSPVPVAHVMEDRGPAGDPPAPVQDKAGAEPLAGQLDDIPEFLRRGVMAQAAVDRVIEKGVAPEVAAAAHAVANKHNKLPTEDQKKLVAAEKRKVKEEHKHAELTGARRKPPLTGRAAEAFLRGR